MRIFNAASPLGKAESSVPDPLIINSQPGDCGKLIRHLEDALALVDELGDGTTGYLIERALDCARAQQFKPFIREA
jgi:hypothetical protein